VGFDRGGHLVGAMPGPVGPVGQGVQATAGIAAQPAVDGLATDPVALGHLYHCEPVTQHLHDGVEALLCHRELQEHAPDLLASTRSGRSRGRSGGHVNHQPELWKPSAGITTLSINRISTRPRRGPLPEICQKLRYT
jgi:hypothetical protein